MSSSLVAPAVVLEPAAQAFVNTTAIPPFRFELGPANGRETLDEVQPGPVDRPEVEIAWITVPRGPSATLSRSGNALGYVAPIFSSEAAGMLIAGRVCCSPGPVSLELRLCG